MLQKYYPDYLRLLKLAMPLVLTQAGQMTVQLIDIGMVGRVGILLAFRIRKNIREAKALIQNAH